MATAPIVSRISDYFDPSTGVTRHANGDAGDAGGMTDYSDDRWTAKFSGDGRFVMFMSTADNIVWERFGQVDTGEPFQMADLFVHVVDSGYNHALTWDVAPVQLPGSSPYAPSFAGGAINPVGSYGPEGSGYVLVAVATDSQGRTVVGGPGPGPINLSDGSYDIGYFLMGVSASAIPGAPTMVQARSSEMRLVGSGENANGVMAFSGDGQHLAYVSVHISGDELRISNTDNNRARLGASQELLQANGFIYRVSVSHDGNLIAFDSTATLFDLDGDQLFEVKFGDTDGYSNVFVFDRAAGTLTKVTHDSELSQAGPQGGYVGTFVPDPKGTGVPQLSVVSIADPATQ